MTQCSQDGLFFQASAGRAVVAHFDGGKVTSDAGGVLLREVEARFGLVQQFARCFTDYRDPALTEHTLEQLLKQRIFGLCLGYEDLNDLDRLRFDPLLAVLVDKRDPEGTQRVRVRDRGKALAGKSTLNRLELTPVRANADSRYKKITANLGAIEDFLFGLAKNRRLLRILGGELHQAQQLFAQTQHAARVFKDFSYRTRTSWSRERRVVGKAEHLAKGANPRFVVTSLSPEEYAAQTLYEHDYCGRGDRENRIKEQQRMLFADRMSCRTMRANQLRLYLSTVAYVVLRALREFGLKDTALAPAQCDTIRLKLLTIGAVIRVTVRKVWLSLSEAYPFRDVFRQVWQNLQARPVRFAPSG